MPSALLEAKDLIAGIQAANLAPTDKARLLYVNKLNHRKIQNPKAAWLLRNPDFGLSPLVSGMQQSPAIGKGSYRMLEASAICTRHLKTFTDEELRNLISPDPAYRIDAKQHLVDEMLDSERRIWDTMEYVAHCALAEGELHYILNDAIGRMDVKLSFPQKKDTAAATWATAGTNIVSHMDAWIKAFVNRAGIRPDVIRMTTNVWDYVKVNTGVLAIFSAYMRTMGMKVGEIPRGTITPPMVAQALDWPTIELYDARTQVKYACTNNETAGSNVTIELPNTWGIREGDKILGDYKTSTAGIDDWDFEATVTSVNPGKSITVDTIPAGSALTAGEYVACKPTFFPANRILLAADEMTENEFLLTPFGIEYSGSEISVNKWYGPRMDVFNWGGEPGVGVARRNWHEFGLRMGNPNKLMSCKVIL